MEYVDDMVIDGLFNSIECSLRFFLDNTGKVLMKNSRPQKSRFDLLCGFFGVSDCYLHS